MASSAAGPSAAVTTMKPVALEVGPDEPDDLGVVVDDEDRRRGIAASEDGAGIGSMVGAS